MSTKEDVKALALAVNEALTAYVAVHDRIFRDGSTFTSVIKNLVGRGVPMSELLESAEALTSTWADLHLRLEQFRNGSYESAGQNEKTYLL